MSKVASGVFCPYCDQPAKLVTGATVYPHRDDLKDKWFWYCAPCWAWVGCHSNSKTHQPLGRLANGELRLAKQAAHAVFDPLWRAKIKRDGVTVSQARKAAYKWLSDRLGIELRFCHIGMMDVSDCKRVAEICKPYAERLKRKEGIQ